MSTIVERKLRNRKNEREEIGREVSEEQITPTAKEKAAIGEIIKKLSNHFRKELTDQTVDKDALNARMEEFILDEIRKLDLGYKDRLRLEKLAVANIVGLGPLQQYLDDPTVTEIVVQRYDNICVERKGKIENVGAAFADEDSLQNVINRILQPVGRQVNYSSPIVDAHLKDGSRICATIPPVSPKGATLTIRKFNNAMMTADRYVELRSLSPAMLEFLKKCTLGKVSIYVSGGTGSGKTTFLNMLSAFIPEDELIVTIEDTLELQLRQKNVRALETRPIANGEMESIDMAALVKASLRMRPSRIIVGETRDCAVVSLLSAMSTGHEGSMSTGHANSPENLVNVRMPIMMGTGADKTMSFTEQAQALMISEAIQLIVQLRRLPNGRRVVSQICEMQGVGADGKVKVEDVFRYDFEKDEFVYTGFFPAKVADHASYYGVSFDEAELAGTAAG